MLRGSARSLLEVKSLANRLATAPGDGSRTALSSIKDQIHQKNTTTASDETVAGRVDLQSHDASRIGVRTDTAGGGASEIGTTGSIELFKALASSSN